MLIFLIGFMGAGKSSIGIELAKRLNLDFIDLDKALGLETGISIEEWFEDRGEDAFRVAESECIHAKLSLKNTIIATGGGTPCFHNNMDVMNKVGITIYLKLHSGSIYHRLAKAGKDRPLLKGKTDVELMEYILITLDKREVFYSKALITIKDESPDLNVLEKLILKKVND